MTDIDAIIAMLHYIEKELPKSFRLSGHMVAAARLALQEEAAGERRPVARSARRAALEPAEQQRLSPHGP